MLYTFDEYLIQKCNSKQQYKEAVKRKRYHKEQLLHRLNSASIDDEYLNKLAKNKRNKFYVFTNKIIEASAQYTKDDYIGCIVYRELYRTPNVRSIVIMAVIVDIDSRGLGYGSMLLDEFCLRFIESTQKLSIEFILHSLKKSEMFYRRFGFVDCHPYKMSKVEDIGMAEIILHKIYNIE